VIPAGQAGRELREARAACEKILLRPDAFAGDVFLSIAEKGIWL